jgi:hypothetical protein
MGLLLREHELAVAQDVELAVLAGGHRCVEALLAKLGGETRRPPVVTASDRAIEDLDAHEESIADRGRPP